jgi:hypothetical protein
MNLTEQLRIDAEQIAITGGDRKAIAKCLLQAADHIAKLEARLDAVRKVVQNVWDEEDQWVSTYAITEALEQQQEARDD